MTAFAERLFHPHIAVVPQVDLEQQVLNLCTVLVNLGAEKDSLEERLRQAREFRGEMHGCTGWKHINRLCRTLEQESRRLEKRIDRIEWQLRYRYALSGTGATG